MEQTDADKEKKRDDALRCVGERFLTHIYSGRFDLKLIQTLPELFEMYKEAAASGRAGTAEIIKDEILSRLPWASH